MSLTRTRRVRLYKCGKCKTWFQIPVMKLVNCHNGHKTLREKQKTEGAIA